MLHRSSLALTRSSPVRGNPDGVNAGASANCGILRRKSASSLSVSQSGLAGVEGGPVPVDNSSGVAALRAM
ncbi:hypothetical protein [Escherichia coli]|uniref:hypothetical protein n=1 Tax=Escherichia coli TaxID=562 RepID=UPI000F544EEA|nr:hypothetical protein [Escherichia coli]